MQTYYFSDGLGSVTDLTDDEGDMVNGYTYDVFGPIRSQSGSSDNPWLFTGEQQDADSEMYYLRARYYDPAIGRFLSQDPLPTGNPYAYVRNNPVRFVDPSGLCIPGINCPPGLGGGTQPPSLARSKEGANFCPAPTPTANFCPAPTPTPTPTPTPWAFPTPDLENCDLLDYDCYVGCAALGCLAYCGNMYMQPACQPCLDNCIYSCSECWRELERAR